MYSVKPMVATSPMNCTSVMLRNHFIVDVSVDAYLQIVIGIYYAILILIESSLFATLLVIHYKIRKGFHPFFGLLFGLILLCYIVCGVLEALCQFLFLSNGSEDRLSVTYMLYDLIYSAITILCFCCLIERTIATMWAVSYETNRSWFIYTVVVSFSVTAYVYFACFQCRGCFVSAIVTSIIILGCVGLYFLNRKWTLLYQTNLQFMGKVSLSTRYQIIENLIVVRKALLPVIILDSLVTLVDSLSIQITTNMEEKENQQCHSIMTYVPYIALNHLAMILEYSIPLYMLFRRAYRRQLPLIIRKFYSPSRIESRESIQNVFGRDLNVVETQNEYFAKLKNEWK